MADEQTNTGLKSDGSQAPGKAAQGYTMMRAGQLLLRRYLILSILGRGGMGTVYRVRDELAGVNLALKAIPPELARDFAEMKTVRQNFRLVHELHHPNIANLNTLEQDPENGAYYLLMECVTGEELSTFRERHHGKQPLSFWLPILRQVVAALEYAHHRKIIHRDIKPSNIFISDNGEVKLLDFGIASEVHTTMHGAEPDVREVTGTVSYMAPEQWQGKPQGPEADQYALAVTIYQLIAGHCPFVSDVVLALREAVLTEEPLRPEGVSNASWKVLKKALAKDPADRYRSCRAFMAALDKSCQAPGASSIPGWGKALLAGAGLSAIGLGYFLLNQEPGEPVVAEGSSSAAPLPRSVAEPVNVVEAPAASSDQDGPAAMAASKEAEAARIAAADSQAAEYANQRWTQAEDQRKVGEAAIKFNLYDKALPALREAVVLYAEAQQLAEKEAVRMAAEQEAKIAERRRALRAELATELRKVQQAMNEAGQVRTEAPDVWREIQKDLRQSNALVQQEKFAEASGSLRNVLIRLESVMLFLRSRTAPEPVVAAEAKPEVVASPKPAPVVPAMTTISVVPPAGFRGAHQFELLQNGKSMGKVDLPYGPIKLSPGPHNFQLRGHLALRDSEVQLINLKPGAEQAVSIAVQWRPSRLEFEVVPADAVLVVQQAGGPAVPVVDQNHEVRPGVPVTITASAPGYRSESRTVTVDPGQEQRVAFALKKNPKIFVRP